MVFGPKSRPRFGDRTRLNYTVKGAVDLDHLHGDIFFDGTVSRSSANLCSRIRCKSDTGDDTDRRMLLDITGNDSRYC